MLVGFLRIKGCLRGRWRRPARFTGYFRNYKPLTSTDIPGVPDTYPVYECTTNNARAGGEVLGIRVLMGFCCEERSHVHKRYRDLLLRGTLLYRDLRYARKPIYLPTRYFTNNVWFCLLWSPVTLYLHVDDRGS